MSGQIVETINDKDVVSEASLKCGDPFFKDFPKDIYGQAAFRAERGVALYYNILDRKLSYTNTAGDPEFTIAPLNFNGEWRVSVLHPADDVDSDPVEVTYKKVQYEEVDNVDNKVDVPTNRYAIIYDADHFAFRYTPYIATDIVNIWYTSSIAQESDYDSLVIDVVPIIPNKYYEEVLRRTIIYVAEIGIATFDQLKAKKYARLLRLYGKNEDKPLSPNLEKDRPWIKMKAFSTQFPGD